MGKLMLFASIFVGLLIAALPHIVWLVVWAAARIFGFSARYAPFGWTAVGLVTLCWCVLAYGFFVGRRKLDVTHIDYSNPSIPAAFDGYRLVHISDLHLSTFDDNPAILQRFVDSINAQQPDLICFTGDLVTLGVSEALPYEQILKGLSAKDGVASVLGNHDFLIYSRSFNSASEREEAVQQLAEFERARLGWNVLRNGHLEIERDGGKLTVLGVDNQNCANQGFQTISRGDLQQAMQGTDGFRLLLTHDPSHWQGEVLPATDIPLTLSGHTHAAQIKLFGWTPASWSFNETDGLYSHGSQTLYVNVGLGCTLPIRLGANAEVTVITLRKGRE